MSTQATRLANGGPEPKSGDKPGEEKIRLVLLGAAALGAYEVGAIEYLYEPYGVRDRLGSLVVGR